MKSSALFLIMFIGLSVVFASAQEKQGVKEEGAHQAEYNSDSQDRDHSGEIDSRVQPSEDQEGAPADAGDQDNSEPTEENVEMTPTGTRTTSPSGSPGVLMEDEKSPDGTNTRPSAQPNIAGSPVPGGDDFGASGNSEVPENKVFSGETQKETPGTERNKREKKNDRKKKKKD
ncbi:MAG TPA: hypothetical protein VKZ68_07790 [Ohtaekwangia sp.]|nr:hypothetical protein [Ohtaekwangia sp.]